MLSGCRLSVVCGWVGVGDVHVCVTQTQNGDRDVCVCVCMWCNMCVCAGMCLAYHLMIRWYAPEHFCACADELCLCVGPRGGQWDRRARRRCAQPKKKHPPRPPKRARAPLAPSARECARRPKAAVRCRGAIPGKNPIGARSDGRAGKKRAGFRAGRQSARERRGPAGLVRAPSADRATDRSTTEPADRHDEGCRRIRARAERARPRRPRRRAARGCARGRAAAQAAPARRPHRAGKRRGGACALRMCAMRAVS